MKNDNPYSNKTPFEIACEWYKVGDIRRSIFFSFDSPNSPPSNVESFEFAEWLTAQYRLAMAKGIEIGRQ